jgi:UDP-N-acetylmuramate: L-alanyl-gamma-D-glutamyl-meso-diaminopimelate ligase
MHIHVLGICGTFMGGIAVIAKQSGHEVTGCDANVYPPMSTQLELQGIRLIEGWDPNRSSPPELFVIGNVCVARQSSGRVLIATCRIARSAMAV